MGPHGRARRPPAERPNPHLSVFNQSYSASRTAVPSRGRSSLHLARCLYAALSIYRQLTAHRGVSGAASPRWRQARAEGVGGHRGRLQRRARGGLVRAGTRDTDPVAHTLASAHAPRRPCIETDCKIPSGRPEAGRRPPPGRRQVRPGVAPRTCCRPRRHRGWSARATRSRSRSPARPRQRALARYTPRVRGRARAAWPRGRPPGRCPGGTPTPALRLPATSTGMLADRQAGRRYRASQ